MVATAPVDAVMQALAAPTRRAVFERIVRSGEITVVELTRGSGVTQGAISQHLKSLKQAGLVAERPEGRNVYYRAQPEGLAPLVDWMSHYGVFWRERFAKLRDKLAKDQADLDLLQRELGVVDLQAYSDPMKALQQNLTRSDINAKAAKIDQMTKQVEADKQAISDAEDQLRKSGGDVGWAR